MKILASGLALAVLALAPVAAQGKADTTTDIQNIIGCIEAHKCRNTIVAKDYPDVGHQLVFVDNGKRYTIYWTGDKTPGLRWLSFWVRPEGTGSQSELVTFTDQDANGTVDFGVEGESNWPEVRRKLFRSPADKSGPKNEQFRSYWQQQFDEALAASKRRLF